MKKVIKILKIIIIIAIIVFAYQSLINNFDGFSNLKSNTITGNNIVLNKNEKLGLNPTLTFCPSTACYDIFQNAFAKAKSSINCAFFDLSDTDLAKELINRSKLINVSVIVDDNYLSEKAIVDLKNSNVKLYSDAKRGTKYDDLMHDKFCVIDGDEVITGSTNPTYNGLFRNNNNLLVFDSRLLAKNYENEFNQMASGIFGTNKHSVLAYNNISLKFENQTYIVNSYFCPQDKCTNHILQILNSSKKEILFASFVITSNPIGNLLVQKAKDNVSVKGVVETREVDSRGSIVRNLSKFINITFDKNKYTMHHKFFIVDDKYVITGSMNPTKSGNWYNDENILIIKNKNLATRFKKEFFKLVS